MYRALAEARIDGADGKNMQANTEKERVTWFSMWFLASIATFGIAFFPMFYRLIDSRNRHFRREAELERQISDYIKKQGRTPPTTIGEPREMKAIAWTASINLIVPAFIIDYSLCRDLHIHEKNQDEFLAGAFPERMFMPQTIPIQKYVLLTIVTLGIGGIYWLYKVANLYNAHFKAQWKLEEEIARLMEENNSDKSV